ncbi:MAG: acetyl-CoA C-acyltransferase [Chloroflexota bacterium]
MSRDDVVIVSGVRTAIGTFGGSLKDVPASELGATVVREALRRAGVRPEQVEHVVFGQVLHTAPEDPYIARVVGIKAGLPVEVPGLTLNRRCGSGLEAICTAARMIRLEEADVAVAGGVESMSRVPYWLTKARWGIRLGDDTLVDALVGGLNDPFYHIHMGVTAENLAERYCISRERQDVFALESHRRAIRAIDEGRFKTQIVPVEVPGRKGETVRFEVDEHPRRDTNLDKLSSLKPVFKPGGTVTAGNASGINDGAAAVVLTHRAKAQELGIQPIARLVAYATAGVEPQVMGIGPAPAIRRVLKKAGLNLDDIDVIELNEAFAAQCLAVMDEVGLDPEKTNPNGGAVALGHPVGATGAILTVKAIYELHRIRGQYALVTMCIGGGEGIAAIFEREGDGIPIPNGA